MSCRRKDYKDINKFRKTKNKQNQRYRLRTGSFLYPRKAWDIWEDELILKHEYKDVELAVMLERSVQAIQIRRCRIKKAECEKYEI